MQLSPQQDPALQASAAWLRNPAANGKQVFRLFGYAGTGKSTLAKRIADDADGTVLFAAFTGKAALVMRRKGCAASTIHSDLPWHVRRELDPFDFGYALTVHKAQGSQWDNVVVFDEAAAFRQHHARWTYTAITSAADQITIAA